MNQPIGPRGNPAPPLGTKSLLPIAGRWSSPPPATAFGRRRHPWRCYGQGAHGLPFAMRVAALLPSVSASFVAPLPSVSASLVAPLPSVSANLVAPLPSVSASL